MRALITHAHTDDEAEAAIRCLRNEPQVGSLWRKAPVTHLDRDLVARTRRQR